MTTTKQDAVAAVKCVACDHRCDRHRDFDTTAFLAMNQNGQAGCREQTWVDGTMLEKPVKRKSACKCLLTPTEVLYNAGYRPE